MTNYLSGHAAEKQAASYLKDRGFEIIELNWKTRRCEIDIVATKNKVAYLVEVKSRRSAAQGLGFDYITPKKLQQMIFAAQMWAHSTKWTGDYRLAAISVDSGTISFVEI